ncbi:DivIVA domain-containing protein [Nocardioides euryhalodurans]|uniref:Cell wall synthesis protein Wag31 n=1 Tax=Nocardioides euryhalodurans TaxID=2518370 RepID=A0A4P7GPC1_9ACTN|nr:DivIVA domain-containing protein [Nocardioides euryhalodurans]QBR93970.1 DivIVA domain-containing protein [Nocardioides euryhalodurans]
MIDTDHRQDPSQRRMPDSIRDETFQRRVLGGLDQDEVYAYLDRLADQVEAAEQELSGTLAENERLRRELQRVQGELDEYEQIGDRVNEQVVDLFSQAQLVAEEMVQDVRRDARERIDQARAHERKIVEQALDTAGKQVSTYARSAQDQMRSILDTFATEVDRLGTPLAGEAGAGTPGPTDPLVDDWLDPQTPSRNGRGPESAGSR